MSTETIHSKTQQLLVPELRFKEFDGVILKKRFDEIIDRITYGFTNPMPEAESGPYLITARDVKWGEIQYDSCRRTTEEAFETLVSDKSRPNIGDILLTKDGTLGRVALVDRENCCINQSVALIQPGNDFDSQFLKQILLSQAYQNEMLRNAGGSTIKHLYITTVGKMQVIHPSLPEQQKIASFLSAVDEKIQQLTKKKELLEQYKKGAMQQLFSGKLRFKDESGKSYPDWEEKRLGEVTKYTKGFAFKSEDYQSSGMRIVRVSDLLSSSIKTENEKVFISYDKAKNFDKYQLVEGNIIITTVGSKPEMLESAVGRGIYINNDNEGLLNQNMLKFENIEGVTNQFIIALINSRRYQHYMKGIARGNANQANITVVDLLQYKVSLPSLPEQQKIATYLSSIDTKIELVNQQIAQTQSFKKGLLQQMFV
jgi:type I restriction enzyme S subunit